jgi:hypothetical protein
MMLAYLLSRLQSLMRTARDTYGVGPIIFLVIHVICAPFWHLSLFGSLRALTMKRMREVMLWSTVFLITSVAPFVYVMLFGRNRPGWVLISHCGGSRMRHTIHYSDRLPYLA